MEFRTLSILKNKTTTEWWVWDTQQLEMAVVIGLRPCVGGDQGRALVS